MIDLAKPAKLIKSDGQVEIFLPEKLRASLKAAGAGSDVIDEALQEFQNHVGDPLSTRQIHNIAFRRLRKSCSHHPQNPSATSVATGTKPSG